MKQKSILITMIIICAALRLSAQIAVTTDGSAPDNSAMLDVKSTSKGMLIPRMTLAQRNAIASPAAGLILFQTDNTPGFYFNAGTAVAPVWTFLTNNGWSITGNGGTNPALNFIGTTDNNPVNLRVNNQKAGKVGSDGPVFLGYQAGNSNTANYSTGIGYQAMFANTTGNYNSATGYYSLFNNTTGAGNTATGYSSLMWSSTGYENTATGGYAMFTNSTGSNNTANGFKSLYYNTTGNFNTAIGNTALYVNVSGQYNTASGASALYSNNTGSNNTATGYQALIFNATGSNNTATGVRSLRNNNGVGNTAIGTDAMYYNSGYSNVAVGISALYSNYTGSNLVAVGDSALYSNTSGVANMAIGSKSLYANSVGYSNTAAGFNALKSNTSGFLNTAVGRGAMENNTTGDNNSGLGRESLYANTTGSANNACGVLALFHNSSGNGNSATGYSALFNNTSGDFNTACGYQSLGSNQAGTANIAIGKYAGFYETGSDRLYIDNRSRSNLADSRSKALIYGVFDEDPALQRLTINGFVGIGTTNPTYPLAVNGTIRAKEIVVNTGWSDFVFNDTYNLMPLKILETYITEHKHLPEIPDAADVEKNGVSLGNMDAKLLQKIEELSLYVIELNKKLEHLEGENTLLKNQVKAISK
jgi:hypothetical protein